MFELIAAIEKAVVKVMLLAMRRMHAAPRMPACPTTNPARMNMMTPRIVKMLGVKTPPSVPNP